MPEAPESESSSPGLWGIDPKILTALIISVTTALGSCYHSEHKAEQIQVAATADTDSLTDVINTLDAAVSDLQIRVRRLEHPKPHKALKHQAEAPAAEVHGFKAFWKKLGFLGG